jgi:hypothetical protein
MKKLNKMQELYLDAFKMSVGSDGENWTLIPRRGGGDGTPPEYRSPLYGDKLLQMVIRHTEYGRVALLYKYDSTLHMNRVWEYECIRFGGFVRRRNMAFEVVFHELKEKMLYKKMCENAVAEQLKAVEVSHGLKQIMSNIGITANNNKKVE